MANSKLDVAERNMISNALGLQAASFKRAINANVQNPELHAYYTRQNDLCNALIAKMNNMELFV